MTDNRYYYISSAGAVYSVRKLDAIHYALAVRIPPGGDWIQLPGERAYPCIDYAINRLRALSRANRWDRVDSCAANGPLRWHPNRLAPGTVPERTKR